MSVPTFVCSNDSRRTPKKERYAQRLIGCVILISCLIWTRHAVLANSDYQQSGRAYVVITQDSLYKIAENEYGSGNLWRVILEATNQKAETDPSFTTISDPALIRTGQKVWLPSNPAEVTPSTPAFTEIPATSTPIRTPTATSTATPTDTPTRTQTPTRTATATQLPSVSIDSPADGATVGTTFEVAMSAVGLEVEPAGEINEGAGHFHILVDTDFVEAGELIVDDAQHIHYGQGQLLAELELPPGEHVLRLQFANGAHIALEGEQYQDEIIVTVEGDDASDEPSVSIDSPADAATVQTTFEVAMSAVGLEVEPAGEINEGAGHFHILVDTDFVEAGELIINDAQHIHYGQGQLLAELELPPGEHVLRLQFANGAHIALEGEQYQDEITVTVEGDDASDEPSVSIDSPADGATVGTTFEVAMSAVGLEVEPAGEINEGAGHFHILVDTDFVEAGELIINDAQHIHYGQGQLLAELELPPGEHVLRLQFANGAHIALEGEQYQDEIIVTVEGDEAPDEPSVSIDSPADGATVGTTFEVAMSAVGLEVEPAGEINEGAGHFHILVDTDFVEAGELIVDDAQHIHYGQGQLLAELELPPGEHVLRLQFANGAHIALEGERYQDEITVTVEE